MGPVHAIYCNWAFPFDWMQLMNCSPPPDNVPELELRLTTHQEGCQHQAASHSDLLVLVVLKTDLFSISSST